MSVSRRSKPKIEFPNLSAVKRIVYDTESTGVDWKRDRVVGHVITWGPSPGDTVYFPTGHEGGGNLPKDSVQAFLRNLLSRPDLAVVGHALKFDLHMAQNEGIDVRGPLECTQVNEALIDENQNHYNLDDTASRYKGVPAKKGDALYKELATRFGGEATRKAQIGNFYRLPGNHPLVKEYAEGDGTTTWHLREAQQVYLDKENLRTVWGVERRVTRTLYRMERRGVMINEERLHALKDHLNKVLQISSAKLPKDFNVRSTAQIEKLYRDSGYAGKWPTTDKGNPSFTQRWLETNEIGTRIIAVRQITNLFNSFINPLLEVHLFNGKVHCNYNQLAQDDYGTVTGRLSCNGPNLQQVPKRNRDLAALFRCIFVVPPGWDWSANDYAQQEYVLFAEYTGSEKLQTGYNSEPPIDIHTNVANILGVERDPTAKRMNFGMVNGMGSVKLAASLNWPLKKAKEILEQYHSNFPEAREYLSAAEYWAKQRGWVKTKLGRRRRFPDVRFAHKAGNNVIQGSAADITKLKMVEIDEYFESEGCESYLMLQVHDELDWAVAPGEDKHDIRAREIMESFGEQDLIHLKTRLRVDNHRAGDWARASFPKHDIWPKWTEK
jgi:DNA polymerase-1